MYKFIKARLLQPDVIELIVYGPLIHHDVKLARLRVNHTHLYALNLVQEDVQQSLTLLQFQLPEPVILGNAYEIIIESFGATPVDVTAALHFPNFHSAYTYDGHDLGATYTSTHTVFKVWAPLASAVNVLFFDQGQLTASFPMTRSDQGVYACDIQGDLDGQAYKYDVTNHGVTISSLDPYGIGSTRNSEHSVVINPQRIHDIPTHRASLPVMHAPTDAILYEAHVRDLTSAQETNIVHKGRFLGALERGRTHQATGESVGWDYFTSLGFTHLQLLPVNDYRSVDEFQLDTSYNWGYDPYQFFAVEGSYASDLDDPYSRLIDFKTFVSRFHEAGIRINVDVVYNHVYEFQYSVFEKVVPGYYFRKKPDGTMSNGSFCGNDVASEKPMVRHLLVHVATHWVKMFDIDGYRFDLMGIIDQTTMKAIEQSVKAIKSDFMLYGEGWNMPTELPYDEKTITEHHRHLPAISFFNDAFRNVMKGGNFEHDILSPGFTTGQVYDHAIVGLWLGSSLPAFGIEKVTHPYQSINYVECHDNGTYYDKLVRLYPTATEEQLQAYIRFSLSVVMLAQGIPFLHMGQEIGGTKFGDHNSYQSGDTVNQFHVDRLHAYAPVIQTLKDLIAVRKSISMLRRPSRWDEQSIRQTTLEHGAFTLQVSDGDNTLMWVVNPSLFELSMPVIPATMALQFDGRNRVQNDRVPTIIPPLSVLILTSI
jgi:pullulanase